MAYNKHGFDGFKNKSSKEETEDLGHNLIENDRKEEKNELVEETENPNLFDSFEPHFIDLET